MLFGKNYDNAFYFSKLIRDNIHIVVSSPEAVCDNVVSNDVITNTYRRGNIRNKLYIFLVK